MSNTYDLLDELLGKLREDQHKILNLIKKTPPVSEVKKTTKEIIHDK